jgi:hypothetical protein
VKIGWLPWRKPLVCERSQVRDLRHEPFSHQQPHTIRVGLYLIKRKVVEILGFDQIQTFVV